VGEFLLPGRSGGGKVGKWQKQLDKLFELRKIQFEKINQGGVPNVIL
jgi:hypothetical protein